jgi:RNA polymerase sigma-70 factor (ECF subfamily)
MGLSALFLRPSPEQLVREHGPRVRALLRRMFGPSADIDDVFQNVFVEAVRSLPRFEGRARASTWIHRIALNVAYQEMRSQYGRANVIDRSADAEHVENATLNVFAEVERKQAAERVHAALAVLPPKQRIAVTLHYFEGMALREIADQLGLPLQTVASQVRAGRAKLADVLAELHTGGPVAAREEPSKRGAHE